MRCIWSRHPKHTYYIDRVSERTRKQKKTVSWMSDNLAWWPRAGILVNLHRWTEWDITNAVVIVARCPLHCHLIRTECEAKDEDEFHKNKKKQCWMTIIFFISVWHLWGKVPTMTMTSMIGLCLMNVYVCWYVDMHMFMFTFTYAHKKIAMWRQYMI